MSRIRYGACVVSIFLASTTMYGAGAASASGAIIITHNRAGYLVAGDGAVHRASASWTQPTASCGALRTFANIQVGVTNRGQGLQVGTAADCKAGQPVYYAWHSFNGHRSPVHGLVSAGDRMQVTITYRHRQMGFDITNVTKGWGTGEASCCPVNPPLYRASFLVTARSNGARALPLTDFGDAKWFQCRVNGTAINLLGVDYVAMETPAGVSKASALPLQPVGRFAVIWEHH